MLLSLINANAQTTSFYEAEYIDNIYISKYQYSNNTIYYQKARLFREINTNEIAYCIEPFRFFNDNSEYNSTFNINNLTSDKLDTIKRLAYYGYGYTNHQDIKWYAITQYLIWQETVENGEIFFTDKLNGKKIYPYQSEINELYNLVNTSKLKPSIINKTHYIIEGNQLHLSDTNNVLNQYNSDKYIIENNKIEINNLKEGSYNIVLTKKYNNYKSPIIFFQSNTSQNLVKLGNIEDENINLNVQVLKSSIKINKLDYDNKSIYPQGEASLDNAIIGLYDENMNLINEYAVINNQINIQNINFGKYFIKEIKSGIGYNLNNNIYEINITENNYNHIINIENQVIKKKIIIDKKYGDENILHSEANIQFEIYNINNELIHLIETNNNGIAEITLPYGIYKIKQINTTNGYQKIEPFNIEVKNNNEEKIELTDYKIPVPNTNKNSIISIIISFLIKLLCI